MSRQAYLGEHFKVEFDANFDLTSGSAVIKYRVPSGYTASQSATIDDAVNGIHSISIAPGDLREAGRYRFWSVATDSASEITISRPIDVLILEEGYK